MSLLTVTNCIPQMELHLISFVLLCERFLQRKKKKNTIKKINQKNKIKSYNQKKKKEEKNVSFNASLKLHNTKRSVVTMKINQ